MQPQGDELLNRFRHVMVRLVREKGPDPTARQMAVFLTAYLDKGPHSVAHMARHLNIRKSAVSRAVDRLMELKLAQRTVDPRDRRKIHIQQTSQGGEFLGTLGQWIGHAETQANDNTTRHTSATSMHR